MKRIKLNDAAYQRILDDLHEITVYEDHENTTISKWYLGLPKNINVLGDGLIEISDNYFEDFCHELDWLESWSAIIRSNSTEIKDTIDFPHLDYQIL